jgi:VWFA-related protein
MPIDLTLLLDTSGSTEGTIIERLKQGVRDTARLLERDDRLRVIAVHHVLKEVIPFQPPDEPLPIERLSAEGGTALYDGLAAAMMRRSTSGRRHVVIAYTDGDDASSITTPAQASEVALNADGVVYIVVQVPDEWRVPPAAGIRPARGGIDPVGSAIVRADDHRRGSADDTFPNEAILRQIGERTGGRVFVPERGGSIAKTFAEILDDYRRGYLLHYVPRGVARDGWHEISVRLTRPGNFEIRARKGWGG